MKNKNKEVMKLIKEFGEVYEKFYNLENEVESEIEYWNNEDNWSEKSFKEDEDYSMRLSVMRECLKGDGDEIFD
jgi:hypothetical protein